MKDYKNILIVDDSETSRMIIQRCLEMAGLRGVQYTYAENGLEALSVLKDSFEAVPVDLVITDLNMPKMDGRAFISIIKGQEAFKNIRLLVVSSIADSAAEAELKNMGAVELVKKPVSPAKLLAVLEA